MLNIGAFGKILMSFGVFLIIAGAILTLGGRLSWFGHLPGDIYIQKKGFTFFFPVTTSILISLTISLILLFFRRR